MLRKLLLLSGLFLLTGCSWPVRELTDDVVYHLADHPFDIAPEGPPEVEKPSSEARKTINTSPNSRSGEKTLPVPEVATDVQTTAWMESHPDPARQDAPHQDGDVHTAAWTESQEGPSRPGATQRKLDLQIPPQVPGSEAPRIDLPRDDPAAAEREIERIYPELPPLPVEPRPQPGPEGKAYTLADLQRLAAANSPALRQAVSDVEAAKGNLIQAKTYPNPTVGYLVDPSNNNSTAGVQGGFIDQPIITGGKMKLGVAAAQKDLDNAVLALKRARSDLSTAVRNAYFTLLVDKETLVVTQALVQFTDDIYRLQTGLLKATLVAPYEPASLRAQAFIARLAYKQAIASYIYDWKQLVATIGLQQLPLSEVAGRVDRLIPYYDYDEVLAYALQNHTDILTARNVVKKAQYNLKLAQVTPVFPDLDVRYSLEKDFALGPFGTYQTLGLGFPLAIWDQNKGNIIAAQAGLLRASEESHRVGVTLTNNLATAYGNYRNNLYAMEYYRRDILPDLVRYYRGIFARRQVDPTSAFGDLVTAQQTLSANVTSYLGILGSLWSSVVGVADFLQTDDLFQLAKPRSLPDLPDFTQLPQAGPAVTQAWRYRLRTARASGHGTVAAGAGPPLSTPAGGDLVRPAQRGPGTPPPGAGGTGAPPPKSQGAATAAAAPGPPARRTPAGARATAAAGLGELERARVA